MAPNFDVEKLPLGELFLYQIKDLLSRLLSRPGGGALGYPPNQKKIQTIRLPITAANTAYKGPDMAIPEGFSVVIKAAPDNAPGGFVFVGENAAASININSTWQMVPNEAISYQIQNANELYFSGDTAGDAVIFTAEKGD